MFDAWRSDTLVRVAVSPTSPVEVGEGDVEHQEPALRRVVPGQKGGALDGRWGEDRHERPGEARPVGDDLGRPGDGPPGEAHRRAGPVDDRAGSGRGPSQE